MIDLAMVRDSYKSNKIIFYYDSNISAGFIGNISYVANFSATEVYSSVETVNECDVMLREKNVPVLRRPKPKLLSTKSLPNVHDRMKKREVKMQ